MKFGQGPIAWPTPKAEHRPDIEGLRALAVIAVLLFHLGLKEFGGGYVGVDIFFVISGFLIGGIVVREAGEGAFRWSDFLMRRIRRIVPVMLVVLAVVSVAATFLLMPSELVSYAWSLGFSALFLANFHFWLHRGAYAESEHEVLLHMWTLGVEAQFYILLPLIVLGLMRFGRTVLWVGLVVLAFASVTASFAHPSASFYTLPARLWEFLAGMMVAITPLPLLDRRWVREGLALIGLALIVYAVVTFDTTTPFPGWRAVIPCAGTAAIIAAGSSGPSLVSGMLSFAPMRFIGKISYSLYLWHWPVIVLLMLGLPLVELDWVWRGVAIGVSLALSILSWRYIEEPIRRGRLTAPRVVLGSGAITVGLVTAALAFTLSSGWPQRFSDRGQEIASFMEYDTNAVFRSGECFIHHRSQSLDEESCLPHNENGPEVLVIGDSHAAHLVPGLIANFGSSAIGQVTAAGCRPVVEQPAQAYPNCTKLMDWVFEDYLEERRPDLLILAGRWEEDDLPALSDTLSQLGGKGQEVLLVGPASEWAQFVPRLLTLGQERGRGTALAEQLRLKDRAALDARMAVLADQQGTDYVSLLKHQCDPQCRYFGPDLRPLVVDNSHFTLEASQLYTLGFEHEGLVRSIP
ncbi:MAG: acyltransferase family protein [Pseudomonadota bacterium]